MMLNDFEIHSGTGKDGRRYYKWTENSESPNLGKLKQYVEEMTQGVKQDQKVAVMAGQIKKMGQEASGKLRNILITKKLLERPDWKTAPLSTGEIEVLAQRYTLPMAAFNLGGNHWVLMLETPKMINGSYEVSVYNPMQNGETKVIIARNEMKQSRVAICDPHTVSELRKRKVRSVSPEDFNMDVVDFDLSTSDETRIIRDLCMLDTHVGGYNLHIPRYEELGELWGAKESLTQRDYYDCGLWCVLHAAVAWGVKQGPNDFKDNGRALFARDTGCLVITPEDVGITGGR